MRIWIAVLRFFPWSLPLLFLSQPGIADPQVDGNRISWPDDGWYQVQSVVDYSSVCEGGLECTVPAGVYHVINHSTGERWENLSVSSDDESPTPNESPSSQPYNGLEINGQRIGWITPGWYQVQQLDDFTTVCEGGEYCDVSAGSYIVINHTNGERWEEVVVPVDGDPAPDDPPGFQSLSVSGNQITWPDDGWYQVQSASDFSTVCEGGNSCSVTTGDYIVVNHSTGQRWEDIQVGGGPADPDAGPPTTGNNPDSPVFNSLADVTISQEDSLVELSVRATTPAGPAALTLESFSGESFGDYYFEDDFDGGRFFSWFFEDAPPGDYTVTFVASNPVNPELEVRQSVVITLTEYIDPYPQLESLEFSYLATVGENWVLPLVATRTDEYAPIMELLRGPEGLQLVELAPGLAELRWTPQSAQTGSHYVEIRLINPQDDLYWSTQSIEVNVQPSCESSDQPHVLLLSCIESNEAHALTFGEFFSSERETAGNLGDINGDGYDDVFISTSRSLGRVGYPVRALGFVLYGNSGGVADLNSVNQIPDGRGFALVLTSESGFNSHNIEGIGDVDRDGIDDFAVAVAGSVYLIFGRAESWQGNVDLSLLSPGQFIEFQIPGNQFTRANVDGAGDFNADGFADILIGMPELGENSVGRIVVVFGSSSRSDTRVALQDLSDSQVFTVDGSSVAPRLGGSVAGIGDVDGDGLDDVLIGGEAGSNRDQVHLLYGRTAGGTSSLATLSANDATTFIDLAGFRGITGSSGGGDFNGDGLSDFALNRGLSDRREVTVVFGSADRSQRLIDIDSLSDQSAFRLSINDPNSFSDNIELQRDVSGDALADIVVASDTFYPSQAGTPYEADSTYIVYGSTTSTSLDLESLNVSTGRAIVDAFDRTSFYHFAHAVGDMNSDGIGDMLILSKASLTGSGEDLVYIVYGR